MLDPYSLSVNWLRKGLYLWAFEYQNIVCAKRLIYTTTEEGRLVGQRFKSLPKGIVIPLGGDDRRRIVKNWRRTLVEHFKEVKGRRPTAFPRTITFQKGLDRVLDAMPEIITRIPNVILVVAGEGEADYTSALKRRVEGLRLLQSRDFHREARWKVEVGPPMPLQKCFLLPSRQENFAITVAEAMHIGCPILVSEQVNTWPYVKAAHAGIILAESGIVKGIVDTVVELLGNPALAAEMKSRGRKFAMDNLTWGKAGTKPREAYDEVIEEFMSGLAMTRKYQDLSQFRLLKRDAWTGRVVCSVLVDC